MPLTLSAQFRRVLRSGDRWAAERSIRESPSLLPQVRSALLADVYRQAGQLNEANQCLQLAGDDSDDPALRVFIRRVKGEVLGYSGSVAEAIETLDRALADGDRSGESEQAALAALSRFTLLTNHQGLAESQQALDSAKRAVLRCGDAQLLAALHARVGQAHAQRSLPGLAIAELRSALALLAPEPNAAIESFAKLALSGAEHLLARNREAVEWARSAREVANAAGLSSAAAAANANLAFLECRRGHFARAKMLATEAMASVPRHSLARGALLDTLANIALESGDLDGASGALSEIATIIANVKGTSLLVVDSAAVRVREAQSRADFDAALDHADQARIAAQERGDESSTLRMMLLAAEVRCQQGDWAQAEEDVALVSEQLNAPSAELLGHFVRSRAAVAAASGRPKRARRELSRSVRIFKSAGDRFHARQAIRVIAGSLHERAAVAGRSLPRTDRALALSEDLAVACSLIPHPHLAGEEIVRLFKRLGAVSTGRFVTSTTCSSPTSRTLGLGQVGNEQFLVEVEAIPQPWARMVVSQLMGVLSLAVIAAKHESEAQRKTLSWDVDVAPEGKAGVYVSQEMKRLLSMIRRVAPSDLPILIAGETGTGKEIVAREVHELSRRAQQPFIAFNVSAVPADMLEGQLFGYKRGAFTGAVSDAKGLIREAEGGTLFIDEIGELSLDLQPKLLRFLESGEIQPLGERPQRVDVRIVAATNARLEELVRQGRFRDDLYYRLNIVPLTIPPLRDRREEIPTLVHYFLTRHARDAGKPIPQLTPQALDCLSAYDWPGNVRQLTNELKRVVALSQDDELVDTIHLAPGIRHAPVPDTAPSRHDPAALTINLDRPLQQLTDDIERAAISRALERAGQNFADGARLLGITRKGLYLKRRRLGLDQLEPSDEEV